MENLKRIFMNPKIILPIRLYNHYSLFVKHGKVVEIAYMQLISSENTISWYFRNLELYALNLDI